MLSYSFTEATATRRKISMATTITWLGHSNFFIEAPGINIYIDPFFNDNASARPWRELPKADLVLITHDHDDHVGSAVDICLEDGAFLGGIVGSMEPIAKGRLAPEHILNGNGFNMGGTITYKDAEIVMTPALHSSDSGSPVGYIITLPDGLTIYHAGDTCVFGDMALWGEMYPLDVAMLPIGGIFTMGPAQAAMACKLLNASHVIPMHWGTFPVLEQNTARFATALSRLAPACKPLFLNPNGACYFPGPDEAARLGRA
jgi:L-ascorbate metabolism protein UlaG (beta-lactamase superfamily)